MGISIDEFKKLTKKSGGSKYKNKKSTYNGIQFDSKKEMNRYANLLLLEKANKISNLQLQVIYKIIINGFHVCTYIADFVYCDSDRGIVVEDVKSEHTRTLPVFRIKKKLMKAVNNIEISEY